MKEGFRKKTCLNDLHKAHKGKLVEFAGYEMPVQYADLSIKVQISTYVLRDLRQPHKLPRKVFELG